MLLKYMFEDAPETDELNGALELLHILDSSISTSHFQERRQNDDDLKGLFFYHISWRLSCVSGDPQPKFLPEKLYVSHLETKDDN